MITSLALFFLSGTILLAGSRFWYLLNLWKVKHLIPAFTGSFCHGLGWHVYSGVQSCWWNLLCAHLKYVTLLFPSLLIPFMWQEVFHSTQKINLQWRLMKCNISTDWDAVFSSSWRSWGGMIIWHFLSMAEQMAGFKKTGAYRECHALAGSLNITGLMVGIIFSHQFQLFIW